MRKHYTELNAIHATATLVTHEEYFDLLAKSDFKLEYNAGEIFYNVFKPATGKN